MDGFNGKKVQKEVDEFQGEGAYVTFKTSEGQVIQMQSGLSLVSAEQASINLDAEMNAFNWDFEKAREHAGDVWNKLLGRIKVESDNEINKEKFYTNL